MGAPVKLITEPIVRGASWRTRYAFKDPDGGVENLSLATITVYLRITDASGTQFLRTAETAGEASYPTDGTDGIIDFTFSQAETLTMALDDALIELIYVKTDDVPPTKEVVGRGQVAVEDPTTGAI